MSYTFLKSSNTIDATLVVLYATFVSYNFMPRFFESIIVPVLVFRFVSNVGAVD